MAAMCVTMYGCWIDCQWPLSSLTHPKAVGLLFAYLDIRLHPMSPPASQSLRCHPESPHGGSMFS